MRMLRFVIVVLAIIACHSGCAPHGPETIRVLTYNIRHGEGMDGQVDLERIAEVIRRSDAHLVALQEVDRGVERTSRGDQPAVLAKLTGMRAVFEKNIDFQGGEYGNAILTRLPVEAHQNHYLPKSLPNEQRGLLQVNVRVGHARLVLFATHFDYHADDGERMASVAMLSDLLRQRANVPVIVAGDLNALPDSRVLTEARTFLSDAFTGTADAGFSFPADEPNRRIDYILYTRHPSLGCIECRVIPEAVASDHRPVLAVFTIESE